MMSGRFGRKPGTAQAKAECVLEVVAGIMDGFRKYLCPEALRILQEVGDYHEAVDMAEQSFDGAAGLNVDANGAHEALDYMFLCRPNRPGQQLKLLLQPCGQRHCTRLNQELAQQHR
jgi:hypothetical protein